MKMILPSFFHHHEKDSVDRQAPGGSKDPNIKSTEDPSREMGVCEVAWLHGDDSHSFAWNARIACRIFRLRWKWRGIQGRGPSIVPATVSVRAISWFMVLRDGFIIQGAGVSARLAASARVVVAARLSAPTFHWPSYACSVSKRTLTPRATSRAKDCENG